MTHNILRCRESSCALSQPKWLFFGLQNRTECAQPYTDLAKLAGRCRRPQNTGNGNAVGNRHSPDGYALACSEERLLATLRQQEYYTPVNPTYLYNDALERGLIDSANHVCRLQNPIHHGF